jgi:hypothetical protein
MVCGGPNMMNPGGPVIGLVLAQLLPRQDEPFIVPSGGADLC